MKLEDLVGVYMLDAVDTGVRENGRKYYEDETYSTNYIRFRLDGVVYEAYEDDNDGYRSCMEDLLVVKARMKNTFPPALVEARMMPPEDSNGCADYLLEIVDMLTGERVLVVGTHNTNDYYPCFMASWDPRGLAINQGRKGKLYGQ